MEDSFVKSIISLYKQDDWKKIINEYYNVKGINKLLWVFPSEDNLKFLSNCLKLHQVNSIISIGCGCGLLEWILHKSIGIETTGVEIDGVWWNCKYAPPAFLPLHLAEPCLDGDKKTQDVLSKNDAAILFCYFNDGLAFQNYMKYFSGNILIIIGPGKEKIVHTDPTPFSVNLDADWKLVGSQEVRDSQDFIAVYKK